MSKKVSKVRKIFLIAGATLAILKLAEASSMTWGSVLLISFLPSVMVGVIVFVIMTAVVALVFFAEIAETIVDMVYSASRVCRK